MTNLNILILAAGEGVRMKSSRPKVLHEVAGKPLLGHVLDGCRPLAGRVGVVLGRGADEVKKRFKDRPGLSFFLQKERRGSGDAVKSAAGWFKKRGGDVLVLCGDAPLVRPETLKGLLFFHRRAKNAATVLTGRVENPFGYGRVLRDGQNRVLGIREEKDATPQEKTIKEINSGAYVFSAPDLLKILGRLKANNAKGEYYLTDVIELLVKNARTVGAFCVEGGEEALGVNERRDLALVESIFRRRSVDRLLNNGVTVVDPDTTYIDVDVSVGADTVIYPQTFLKGRTRLGVGVRVGPFSYIEDSTIKDRAEIRASFLYGTQVGADVKIGPYAHLRPGTQIKKGARVGNFVETKNAQIGRDTKVSHLSYIGDAFLGDHVNVGAGVITCNYDGFHKNRTVVGAGAFVGSNANLVAPVRVGSGAVVAAGSTVTRSVPPHSLVLERSAQIIKKGWARQRRQKLGDTHALDH
jgi:bifunctional UDP-N-acetylglucosamine pyrophosphorylase/glucosamine-1-phosphate N-acetyltransferase